MRFFTPKTNQFLLVCSLFVIILSFFFVLNRNTALSADDYKYHFIFNDSIENELTSKRVQNISDVVKSQYNHYFVHSGRVFVHFIVQCFFITENKIWFDVANTLVFGLFIFLLYELTKPEKNKNVFFSYLLIVVSVWWLLPSPAYCLLWISGSLNYLWSAVFLLIFLLFLFQKWELPASNVNSVLYFLSAFFAASTHELVGIPVSLALITSILLNYLTLRGKNAFLIVGFLLGALFECASPGNLIRFTQDSTNSFSLIKILRTCYVILGLYRNWILPLLFVFIVSCFIGIKKFIQQINILHRLLFVSTAFSFLFLMLVEECPQRSFFYLSLLLIIVAISILNNHSAFLSLTGFRIFLLLSFVAIVVEFFVTYPKIVYDHDNFEKQKKQIETSNGQFIEAYKPVSDRFILSESTYRPGFYPDYWVNLVISKFYNKELLICLPQNIYAYFFRNDSSGIERIFRLESRGARYNGLWFPNGNNLIIHLPANKTLNFYDNKVYHLVTCDYKQGKSILYRKRNILDYVQNTLFAKQLPLMKKENLQGAYYNYQNQVFLLIRIPANVDLSSLTQLVVYSASNAKEEIVKYNIIVPEK